MSAPSSAVTAPNIDTYQEMSASNLCTVAITALLLYDIILTSGQEYQNIWRSQKTWTSRVLYLWNRYMSPLYILLELGTIPSISDTRCATLGWLSDVIYILSLIGPAMFTTLRIYALSRENRILGGVSLLLSLTPFILNASTGYQEFPVNLPAPQNCQYVNVESTNLYIGWVTIASRSCLILVDSLAIVVTWRRTRAVNQLRTDTLRKRPSLEQVMWENGTTYFCTLVSLNVVIMVFVVLSIAEVSSQGTYLFEFIDPISSILNSRFLLDLHETNARLEGVDGSITSYSLHIDSGGGEPRTDSPELPQFLRAIGGSIYSFPDSDDLASLELAPTPPSQGEPKPEPKAEIVMEMGRGGAEVEPVV